MRRREALIGLAALGVLAPGAQAQGDRLRRIGLLMAGLPASDAGGQMEAASFKTGLKDLGWLAPRNLDLVERWPGADAALIQAAAKDLVSLPADVIVVRSTPGVAAVLKETRSIPTIFVVVVDPVGSGFVGSLTRPAGNVTGFQNYEFSMVGKWLQLLKEVAPGVQRVTCLYNPATVPPGFVISLKALIASQVPLQPVATPVRDSVEINAAVSAFTRKPGGGLMTLPDIFLLANRAQIIDLAAKHALPAIYTSQLWTAAGGLIAYGPDTPDLFRRASAYVDRILKGEKPGELPVQMANKYTLAVNLKTARALGLKVAPTLLARADEVIQ